MSEATRRKDTQPSTFDDLTLLYVRFLRFIAILPYNGRYHTWLAGRLLVTYWFVSSMIDLSMIGLYLVNGAGEQTIDAIVETVLVLGMNARYYLLLWHRRKLADLLTECQGVWDDLCDDEENRRWVRRFEGKARVLFQALLGSCVLNHVSYSTFAVGLTWAAARHANDTQDAKHFLPYKYIIEGGEDMWPGYKFNFGVQLVVIANACVILATVDSTAPVFIMIGAGYFRALRERLNRAYDLAMSNDDDTALADVELANCCRLHQRILNYCSNIDGITRTIFFTQLLCTGYNLSLIMIKFIGVSYYYQKEKDLFNDLSRDYQTDPDRYKYLALAVLNVGQLFVCQWAPDHLLDESQAITNAVYGVSCPWMKSRSGKHLLMMMIIRAQRPVQMSAVGVVNLSLENFGSMLKSAVSFFTVLRNFNL